MGDSHGIDELIAQYDLGTEEGPSAAEAACIRYAVENLHDRRSFNAFMEVVAEKLGTLPVRMNDFSGTIGDPPSSAKVHVRLSEENAAELTGNAEGLKYLARLMLELAREPIEHDHVHLDPDRPPMHGGAYMVIYHEPDAWFDRLNDGKP